MESPPPPDTLEARDQVGEAEKVLHPKVRATAGLSNERIDFNCVSPAGRQRNPPAALVVEEDAVFAPRLPIGHQLELPPMQRVERVSYPNDSLRTLRIGRS
jgi:hypothetical protein